MLDNGWEDIVTTKFEITAFSPKKFCTVDSWVEFNDKNPAMIRHRVGCHCCKKKWVYLSGEVNLVFTNKGNKTICDECYNKLKECLTKTK